MVWEKVTKPQEFRDGSTITLHMLQQHYDVRCLSCWKKSLPSKNQAVIEQKLLESSDSLVKA